MNLPCVYTKHCFLYYSHAQSFHSGAHPDCQASAPLFIFFLSISPLPLSCTTLGRTSHETHLSLERQSACQLHPPPPIASLSRFTGGLLGLRPYGAGASAGP